MPEVTPEVWSDLRATGQPDFEIPDVRCWVAVDDDGDLRFCVATGELQVLPPLGTVGVACCKATHRGKPCIMLSAKRTSSDAFAPICQEIVTALRSGPRDPIAVIESVLKRWRRLLQAEQPDMETTKQVGLIGELLTLIEIAIPAIGPVAVCSWSGPNYERHDFVGSGAHLEVKTTRASHGRHVISRANQLHPPTNKSLLFVSVQLESTAAGSVSVASLNRHARVLLNSDRGALDVYDAAMDRLGWNDGMERSGGLFRCEVSRIRVYTVNDTFPRLPDSLVLPAGVGRVEYEIDPSGQYEMDASEVSAIVQAGLRIDREF